MITEVHQEGRFYRLSTGRAAHYENIKPHNPSTEYWCIPADMEEGDYLMMDPACEVNEKGTGRRTMETKSWRKERTHRWTWIQTRRSKRTMKPYPTQKKIGRIPNRKRFPRIWNRIFRSRYKLVRKTGQDQEEIQSLP